MWFYFDNPNTSIHVPIYVGVQEIPDSWTIFNRTQFSLDADRWAFMLADDLVNRRYQDAIQDLKAVRDPLQAEFFAMQPAVEMAALELYKKDPALAVKYLTNYSNDAANRAVNAWWELADKLVAKYDDGYVGDLDKVGYPVWWLEEVDFGGTQLSLLE